MLPAHPTASHTQITQIGLQANKDNIPVECFSILSSKNEFPVAFVASLFSFSAASFQYCFADFLHHSIH